MAHPQKSGSTGDGPKQPTKSTSTSAGAMKVKGGATTKGQSYSGQGPRGQKSGSTGG